MNGTTLAPWKKERHTRVYCRNAFAADMSAPNISPCTVGSDERSPPPSSSTVLRLASSASHSSVNRMIYRATLSWLALPDWRPFAWLLRRVFGTLGLSCSTTTDPCLVSKVARKFFCLLLTLSTMSAPCLERSVSQHISEGVVYARVLLCSQRSNQTLTLCLVRLFFLGGRSLPGASSQFSRSL